MAMDPPGIEDQHVPIGAAIYSLDGQRLGRLGAINSGYLRVEVDGSNVYWLGVQSIQAIDSDRLVLVFPAEQLGEYRKDAPPP